MAPAWILVSQLQHERAYLSRDRRAPARAGRLSPLPAHERPMPTQQRPRGDQSRAARGAWQVASRCRKEGTIRGAKVRPRYLAAQDLELVTKDEQVDVFDAQPAATPNEPSQQRPEHEVEKREGHGRRSSRHAREGRDTSIGALQVQRLLSRDRNPRCEASAKAERYARGDPCPLGDGQRQRDPCLAQRL